MLQQTQVKTVIPYWERWMRELPTIASLANAKEQRVLKLWEGLGYYSRARNAQRAARRIVTRDGGSFPSKFEDILELPGIGRYTAGAIASIAYGLATPIVDGNVARVLTRFLGLRGDPKSKETSAALWSATGKLVKAAHEFGACGDLNEALMELGATICVPREPNCAECPVQQKCFARIHGKTTELPEIGARAVSEKRIFRAALVRRGERILLRERAPDLVNGGFWELPNIEAKKERPAQSFQRLFGGANVSLKSLCEVKHTIMRFRISLELFEVSGEGLHGGKFLNQREINALPLVSSHRKVLEKCGYLNGVKQKQEKT